MKTSLTSVTFRSLSIQDIALLARQAGLDAIEWGGDVHVLPGDLRAAGLALAACRDQGLAVSAYGSYWRADSAQDFSPVLDTALALRAPVIRVWAGSIGSGACTPDRRSQIVERLTEAQAVAAGAGCTLATEYHVKTLTDTLDSTCRLLQAVPGLHTLWQPPVGLSMEENLLAIHTLKEKLENIHVYVRSPQGARRPLEEGAAPWKQYFAVADAPHRYATLEFVMDDSREQLLRDADTLHRILKKTR